MRQPASNGLFDWLAAATGDLADSVDRLNTNLDSREKDPRWADKAVRNSLDTLSLRRWTFLLPGGGKARGATKPPAPIPPNNAWENLAKSNPYQLS